MTNDERYQSVWNNRSASRNNIFWKFRIFKILKRNRVFRDAGGSARRGVGRRTDPIWQHMDVSVRSTLLRFAHIYICNLIGHEATRLTCVCGERAALTSVWMHAGSRHLHALMCLSACMHIVLVLLEWKAHETRCRQGQLGLTTLTGPDTFRLYNTKDTCEIDA